MPIFIEPLPLSLYIHIPWCIRKCSYCDFNSHQASHDLPEELYVENLLQELDSYIDLVDGREIISIFFGGGTPSLFSGEAIERILNGIYKKLKISSAIEITLEANPGTVDQKRFYAFRRAGINRLSLGIQSLNNEKLIALTRIHDSENAINAIKQAQDAGFDNLNLDLMYGLPNQTIEEALLDIEKALSFHPSHFSWYQLTLEPNTYFYHHPPLLPADDSIWEMQQAGQAVIKKLGYSQYEISAYAKPQRECIHNRNYWEFGDYLGMGAGAHSKMTDNQSGTVLRFSQVKHPRDFLNPQKRIFPIKKCVSEHDLIFEFMLNALRLTEGVSIDLFTKRTGLSISQIKPILDQAKKRGLLEDKPLHLVPSTLGKNFLNDLISLFL